MVSLHFMLVWTALVRYSDIEPQIRHREITGAKLNEGLTKIVFGLGKVVLLAGVFEQIKLAGLNGQEITTLWLLAWYAVILGSVLFSFHRTFGYGKRVLVLQTALFILTTTQTLKLTDFSLV